QPLTYQGRPARLCGGWWAVAVEGAAVVAGHGGGAVGVERDGPAPPVDHDQVVERAHQQAVGEAGGAALAAGDDVVHVAGGRGLVAAGGGAVPVPGDDGAAQVRGDEVGDGADVQGQADRGGWLREGAGAQPGGQAARPGQQGDRMGEDEFAGAGTGQFAGRVGGAAAARGGGRPGGGGGGPGHGGAAGWGGGGGGGRGGRGRSGR